MQHLHLFEQMQEFNGICGRQPVAVKLSDESVLMDDMAFTQPHMPL